MNFEQAEQASAPPPRNRNLGSFVASTVLGAAINGMVLDLIPARLPLGLSGTILLIAAAETFQHTRH